jgi:hypothetical protein
MLIVLDAPETHDVEEARGEARDDRRFENDHSHSIRAGPE